MLKTNSNARAGLRSPISVRRTLTLVPVALLSAAWTASLTTTSGVNNAAAEIEPNGSLPDGSSVPAQAIEAPASVSAPDEIAGSVGGVGPLGSAEQVVATSSVNGIPSAALAAYQRAETVINAADKSCHLTWQLIAAIGRVESNHGRYGGNVLSADGVANPGIRGIALDGTRGTAVIRDTDAGQYDDDTTYDRAVGPMQFIPSTWAVVGVDADNDGVRNPQDIDDAALATGVYLCSGADDLSTLTGQKASVFRYNHSSSYVSLVLSIMDNYLQGDYMSVPDGTVAAGYLTPDPSAGTGTGTGGRGPGKNDDGGEAIDPEPTAPAEPTEPEPTEPEPTKPPQDNDDDPQGPLPTVTAPALPETSVAPVDDVLTLAQAIVQCTLDGHVDNPLRNDDAFDKCVTDYSSRRRS